MNPHMFREYDIRGIAGKDMDDNDVELIGQGIGTFLINKGASIEGGAEGLVPARVLALVELCTTQRALQVGVEVGQRLGIVPHVRTRALAAACLVVAPFPAPEPPVGLAQHRRTGADPGRWPDHHHYHLPAPGADGRAGFRAARRVAGGQRGLPVCLQGSVGGHILPAAAAGAGIHRHHQPAVLRHRDPQGHRRGRIRRDQPHARSFVSKPGDARYGL